MNPVVRALRQFGRSFRLAVFGRGRPGRVMRDAVMGSTSEIDPAEADRRTVTPAKPPQSTGGPGAPRSIEGHESGTRTSGQGHDELHIPRD